MPMMLPNANTQPKNAYGQPCFAVSEFAAKSIAPRFYSFAADSLTEWGIGKHFNKPRSFSEAISPEKSKLKTKSAHSGGTGK